MIYKLTHLSILLGVMIILTGCFNNDDTVVYQDVEGVVLDQNGNSVANANIHIRNNYNPGGFVNEEAPDEFTVNFNAPNQDVYTVSLFRHGADTTFATFYEDTLNSGQHELVIPDSLLSNGIYGYEIRTTFGQLAANLFLVNKPDTSLAETLPFTTSTLTGDFTLNSTYLALGRSFNTSSGGGFDITDSLQIIVTQDSIVTAKQAVEVKPDKSNFFEIIVD